MKYHVDCAAENAEVLDELIRLQRNTNIGRFYIKTIELDREALTIMKATRKAKKATRNEIKGWKKRVKEARAN
jgi:hypothetical protein